MDNKQKLISYAEDYKFKNKNIMNSRYLTRYCIDRCESGIMNNDIKNKRDIKNYFDEKEREIEESTYFKSGDYAIADMMLELTSSLEKFADELSALMVKRHGFLGKHATEIQGG